MHALKRTILTAIILSFFTGSAFAKMQPYVSLDLGMASSGVDPEALYEPVIDVATLSGISSSVKEDNKDMYYGISGGILFQMSPKFALGPELGYSSGPTLKSTLSWSDGVSSKEVMDVELSNTQIEILATMRYMAAQQIAIIAKLGVISPMGELKAAEDIQKGTATSDVDGIVPKLYVAGQYNFNKNLGLSLFVSNVFGKSAKNFEELKKLDNDKKLDTPSVMAYGLGLSFYF